MKKSIAAILTLLLGITTSSAADVAFVDTGKSDRFIEIDVHALVGGSYVTNNYTDIFPEISDINSSMRAAGGLGAGAKFNFNRFFAIGTELNLTFNSTRITFNVTAKDDRHLSDVYLRNSFRYFNVPIYASFNFNLADCVRWNVDCGLYYSYGSGGKQNATIYTASINDLGQLILDGSTAKTGYFNDSGSFINSYHRSDIGLHIATGLTFYNRVSVGVRTQTGFKNIAKTYGISKPTCHNFNFFATIGYIF